MVQRLVWVLGEEHAVDTDLGLAATRVPLEVHGGHFAKLPADTHRVAELKRRRRGDIQCGRGRSSPAR